MIFELILVITIKDFNASVRDKELREINAKQHESEGSKIEENVKESSVFEKLYEVEKVENKLKSNKQCTVDLNDMEVVTSDQNIYYEL